jgi:hypothetical protein
MMTVAVVRPTVRHVTTMALLEQEVIPQVFITAVL